MFKLSKEMFAKVLEIWTNLLTWLRLERAVRGQGASEGGRGVIFGDLLRFFYKNKKVYFFK